VLNISWLKVDKFFLIAGLPVIPGVVILTGRSIRPFYLLKG